MDREPAGQSPDYAQLAQELDKKSPLEIMDHVNVYSYCFIPFCSVAAILMGLAAMQALKQHGDDIGIAFSGAEDVALVEYAHLTGRPYRVFRYYSAVKLCRHINFLGTLLHCTINNIVIVLSNAMQLCSKV